MSEFHKGSAEKDARDYRGWLVGSFANPESARYTPDVEVKYWRGDDVANHPVKISRIVEVTFLLSGIVQGFVGDEPLDMQAGDYVIIQPGVPNNMVERVSADSIGLTIKAPSDMTAKTVL
jgi:mannose-6-phosphate isomerase-like protein (cupin superfamily)